MDLVVFKNTFQLVTVFKRDNVIDFFEITIHEGESKPYFKRSENDAGYMFRDQIELLAQKDGFDGFDSLQKFFRDNYGLPFTGELVMWEV